MNLPPHATVANYTEQRIPQFKQNPLIEALPPRMNEAALLHALTLKPDFDPEQREWPSSDRIMMLESLQNFMVPMQNHLELGQALDAMMRTGYVGRAPQTPGHAAISQLIYDNQVAGKSFVQTANTRTPQISTSLIGISGMGKTTTVNRWCAHIPKVIYHPDFNLYQIPYLHVEMPSDGSSIKGLAHGILQKIDELIPNANYYQQYAARGKPGADTLMRSVARIMNLHLVGLLICDEVQNLDNARKGGQTVMTELVSACNDLKVPILFIGTNKAAKVLSMDFRQSRRASGHGLTPWDRLYPGTAGEPSEWDDFLNILWQYQWVKTPIPLDPAFNHYMYECSQGIIDLAIKLFSAAQARAILDGTEKLVPKLIIEIFNDQFKLMHPMVEALRTNNLEALCRFDDIAPLNLQHHLENANRKLNLQSSPLFTVKASDSTFTPRLVTGLTAMGFDPEESHKVAEEIADKNPDANLAKGVKEAVAEMTMPKPIRNTRNKKLEPLQADLYDERPLDYRRAIAHASAAGTMIMDQLRTLGMAPMLEDIIPVDV